MAARTCLFCGDPATSQEHVWPEWILKLLPERRPIRQKLMHGPEVTHKAEFKIRCVCSTCNNGWMSDLETSAKSLIGPLVQDISIILHAEDQELIARWITKTAIVIEGTKPKNVIKFFGPEVRKRLMENGSLPRPIIWIGRFAESGLYSNAANFDYVVEQTGEQGAGSVTTMVMGHLVAQILCIKHPSTASNEMVNMRVRISDWHRLLLQIHPSSGHAITWPPPLTFHNHGGFASLSQLKHRWNPNDDGSSEPHL